jgi:hypothetical protein
MKMEETERSETSAYKRQTPGNYPKESIKHSEHGESLNQEVSKCLANKYLEHLKRTKRVFFSTHLLSCGPHCVETRHVLRRSARSRSNTTPLQKNTESKSKILADILFGHGILEAGVSSCSLPDYTASYHRRYVFTVTTGNFAFRGPCIVICSYNRNQQYAIFLNFILIYNSTCFGQTYCPLSGVLVLY